MVPSPLAVENGTTTIADAVVETVVRHEAAQVRGVHSLGAPASGLDRVAAVLPGVERGGRDVVVEVGHVQTAVDLVLVAEPRVPLVRLSEDVRERVIDAIERLTGLEVVEVDITVADVHLDSESG
jgi:uncharacterized alkaline shock family protein YloU